ncbi:hypothetical protein J1N35_026781 [Gossypium stocksii]|uniref:Uncharacterized protein n=1 Tax=Gossypium stocksii TaxID=47602 RepID=A0A9D3VAA7_9ROSI|nr:hypothetical protein J1N35_026781 [Gossypium stocksii]
MLEIGPPEVETLGIHDTIKCEIRSELHSLFEKYFGHSSSTSTIGVGVDKGKGILGSPHFGFSPKEQLAISSIPDLRHVGATARKTPLDIANFREVRRSD